MMNLFISIDFLFLKETSYPVFAKMSEKIIKIYSGKKSVILDANLG